MKFKGLLLNKLKKLILIIFCLFIITCLISPYLVSWYAKKKYNNLINWMRVLIPGIKITSHMQTGYFKSLLMSKIELPQDILWINPNNLNNSVEHNKVINANNLSPQIITLQNEISYTPHKKLLATINTKILIGLPKFIKNFNLITNIDFKGKTTTTVQDIDLNYLLSLDNSQKNLVADKVSILINNDNKNLNIDFKFPKLIYKENEDIVDIDNFKFNIKFKNFNQPKERRIKFLTEIDKLYLISKDITVLRLANFSMEQRISDKVTNNLSFFKLNVLDNKFGPLVTKLQLHNINFSKLIEHFNYLKLPLNQEQLQPYKLIESINQLFQYKPSISLDLLLHIGSDKLKFLSDAMLDSRNSEWFSKEDILNSLTANVFAKIPKSITIDLVTSLVESQQKKKIIELSGGYINDNTKHLLSNDLENLVLEKIQYLINNNILREDIDGFMVNLSIAEGTFFSKNNPFKLFSF